MSGFGPVLQEVSERLDLPEPARTRVLLEIAGDLEELHEAFLARGFSQADAFREAVSRVDLSSEALAALGQVHGGWSRRITDAVSARTGSWGERGLVVLFVVTALVLGGGALQGGAISRAAGPWLIPVVATFASALLLAAWKSYRLFGVRDHRPLQLRLGLDLLMELAVAQMFLAFLAVGVSGLRTLGALTSVPAEAPTLTLTWFVGALAVLVMGLSMALGTGLVWFALLSKVVSVEHKEASALLRG